MRENGWVVLLKSVLQELSHLSHFGEVLGVDSAPITPLHELQKAPKDFFLVRDVEKQNARKIVNALDVTNFVVVVCIGLKNIKHFIVSALMIFAPETKFWHGAFNIFFNLFLSLSVLKTEQLLIQVIAVHLDGLLNAE